MGGSSCLELWPNNVRRREYKSDQSCFSAFVVQCNIVLNKCSNMAFKLFCENEDQYDHLEKGYLGDSSSRDWSLKEVVIISGN